MGFKSVKDQFAKVKAKIKEEKDKPSNTYSNEFFFKPQMVKGEPKTKYRIRILPLEDESSSGRPWVEIRYHMFEREGDGRYTKCIDPRTFDPKAANPIGDLASKLFNSDNALDKEQASKLYRKPRYFVKIFIKEAPENQKDLEGNLYIYEASKTLYEKWMDEIEETDEDEAPFWDPFEGKDFLLQLKPKGDWPDYSDSKFIGSAKAIVDDEEEMEAIYNKMTEINIKEKVLDRDPLKSAEELQEALKGGLGGGSSKAADTSKATDLVDDTEISGEEVDFGDDDVEETTEAEDTPKKEAKAEETDDEEFNEDELDDVDFNDDDFEV